MRILIPLFADSPPRRHSEPAGDFDEWAYVHEDLTIVQPERLGLAVREALSHIHAHAGDLYALSASAHLALLAVGHFDCARRVLHEGTAWPGLPLIAARYAAWSGDLSTVAAAWQTIRDSAELLAGSGGSDVAHAAAGLSRDLRSMAWAELQRTAADVGDPAFAAVLHRRAVNARAAEMESGTPDAPIEDMVLCGPDTPQGRRTGADRIDASARLVLDTVHVLMGAEPDAMRHRLRLRPVLTTACPTLHVQRIRFGDGTARLHGTVEASGPGTVRATWRVAQDSGAIPLTVLLEPRITGTLLSARVDGGPAQLTPRDAGPVTIVPVQLVLDEERLLELDLDAG